MPEWIHNLHASLTAFPLGLYVATYLICVVSGLFPVVNGEVYLLAVSAVSPARALLPLTMAAALGQMTANSALYLVGRGALHLPLARNGGRLRAVRERVERYRGRTGLLTFVSAVAGVPPLSLVSVVSGTMRLRFGVFFGTGVCGRFLRFGLVVAVPQALKAVV